MPAIHGKRHGALSSLWRVLRGVARRRTRLAGLTPTVPTRVLPRLRLQEDGRPRCVACALCSAACPAGCIQIEAAAPPWLEEDVDTSTRRWPAVFDLDAGRCLLCGLCESACPEEAIVLDVDTGSVPVAAHRTDLRLGRDALQVS
jgi:formate hydrogenlyase subunit 6/NADH:ubiquinone oxidoreductase subunit I